jgi:hypothetical protein
MFSNGKQKISITLITIKYFFLKFNDKFAFQIIKKKMQGFNSTLLY